MSGIMAIVSLDGRPVPPELARTQLAAIAHRGEWEPRLWEAPGVALGHVNLPRTPEAEREVLPMPDPAGRYWLTWDGRIDNRDELAPKLGYDVTERASKTDAEYVLDAFIKWGDDCVHHLLGDWAVVIWDNETRRLFCAKDPVGMRQLFYAEHDGLLTVGSNPAQFFAGDWLPKVADDEYVLRLVAWALQEPGATCWQYVRELCGGSVLVSSADGVTSDDYWQWPRPRHVLTDPAEAREAFESVFAQSVASRSRANRPIALLLSGGLDSSYIAATLARAGKDFIPLVGVSARYPEMDEREYSKAVTRHLGLSPMFIDLDDCWPLHRRWMPRQSWDQPFAPPQGSILSKLVHTGATAGAGVFLTGDGGDEAMTGGIPLGASRCVTDAITRLNIRLASRIAGYSGQRRVVPSIAQACYREFVPSNVKQSVSRIRRNTWDGFPDFVEPKPEWKSLLFPEPFSRWEYSAALDWHCKGLRDAVPRATYSWRDRHVFGANRAVSRSPFNDLRVITLMAGMAESVKRHSGLPKAILRDAMRGALPEQLIARRGKAAMNPVFNDGLLVQERELVESSLQTMTLKGIHRERALSMWRAWTEDPTTTTQTIWHLVGVSLWHGQFGSTAIPADAAIPSGKGVIA